MQRSKNPNEELETLAKKLGLKNAWKLKINPDDRDAYSWLKGYTEDCEKMKQYE